MEQTLLCPVRKSFVLSHFYFEKVCCLSILFVIISSESAGYHSKVRGGRRLEETMVVLRDLVTEGKTLVTKENLADQREDLDDQREDLGD